MRFTSHGSVLFQDEMKPSYWMMDQKLYSKTFRTEENSKLNINVPYKNEEKFFEN